MFWPKCLVLVLFSVLVTHFYVKLCTINALSKHCVLIVSSFSVLILFYRWLSFMFITDLSCYLSPSRWYFPLLSENVAPCLNLLFSRKVERVNYFYGKKTLTKLNLSELWRKLSELGRPSGEVYTNLLVCQLYLKCNCCCITTMNK